MRQLRIALRLVFFAIILNGISQSLTTYAIVPDKYENTSYTAEEVNKIAYTERAAGISLVYSHSAANGLTFAILGSLFALDIWLSNRIERISKAVGSFKTFTTPRAERLVESIESWPLFIFALFAFAIFTFLFG